MFNAIDTRRADLHATVHRSRRMKMLQARVLAPAKVNLFLRIRGRRADGYHLLDSLLAPVSLFDELRITVSRRDPPHGSVDITSDSPAAPADTTNLAHRAASLFLAHVDRSLHITIDLRKRIPIGSGLGGGSSDAAAVLLSLNRALSHPLSAEELAGLGAQIGADVSFFVHGYPARVAGIGEQVTRVQLPSLPLVVCWDGFALSTKRVYAGVSHSLTRTSPVSTITAFASGQKPNFDTLVNDLEEPAARIHPQVLSLKNRLMEHGADCALMSGSGSAVFGVWSDLRSARGVAERLQRQGLWATAVQTLVVSPALEP